MHGENQMEILKVTDAEFKTYGKVLEGYDMTDLLKAMEHGTTSTG